MEKVGNILKPLALGISPLGETAVIRSTGTELVNSNISEFCDYHSFNIFQPELTDVTVLSTLEIKPDSSGALYAFGGRAFHRKTSQLVIGSRDVERFEVEAASIRGDCGEFHLVEINKDTVRFSADYFGLQSIYYYDNQGLQVIATSYHLLLLLLRLMNAELEIDVDKSLQMLTDRNVFGSGTAIEMRHCRVNNIEECIELSSSGLHVIVDDELSRQLYDSAIEYDHETYRSLIIEARDEIVDNLKMIFEYDGFDEVIVDLSGGLDSRVIYGACTALPQSIVRKKIRINTQFGPSPNARQGGDLEFAALVNSVYNYALWDDFDESNTKYIDISGRPSSRLFYANKISRLFGSHKNFNHVVPKFSDFYALNTVRLSGFVGEVYRGANFDTRHGDKMSHINNYTNFRNRYMASRPFENILSPLVSKKLLEASRMYQWNHEGSLSITPEADLLTAISPLFSLMPFHNDDLKEFYLKTDRGQLLNFPEQISVSYDFVGEPKSTVVRVKQKANSTGQFVLDANYAEGMLCELMKFDPRIADFVKTFREKGADVVNNQNARVLSMLWSLYFQVEIIHGVGDFFENCSCLASASD